MEIVLVADKLYPYIAKCNCRACSQSFLAKYTDDGIEPFGNVCDCEDDYAPAEGYPSYPEWVKICKKQKEESQE
jgi:hypothetical protein